MQLISCNSGESRVDEKGRKQGNWEIYSTDRLKVGKGKYRDNKKEGKWIYYYPSGVIKSIVNYEEGKKEGVYLVYGEDGTLLKEASYKKDKLIGELKEYYPNKIVKSIINYDEHEIPNGYWIFFYQSGDTAIKLRYASGLLLKDYNQLKDSLRKTLNGDVLKINDNLFCISNGGFKRCFTVASENIPFD